MTSGSSSSKYSGANNAELKELEGVALAEKQKAEGAKRTGELVATLSKIDPANITKNHNIYAELAEINPTNSDYVTKAAHNNKKIKAQEQIAQTRKIKATQAAARKERIESLFQCVGRFSGEAREAHQRTNEQPRQLRARGDAVYGHGRPFAGGH